MNEAMKLTQNKRQHQWTRIKQHQCPSYERKCAYYILVILRHCVRCYDIHKPRCYRTIQEGHSNCDVGTEGADSRLKASEDSVLWSRFWKNIRNDQI